MRMLLAGAALVAMLSPAVAQDYMRVLTTPPADSPFNNPSSSDSYSRTMERIENNSEMERQRIDSQFSHDIEQRQIQNDMRNMQDQIDELQRHRRHY